MKGDLLRVVTDGHDRHLGVRTRNIDAAIPRQDERDAMAESRKRVRKRSRDLGKSTRFRVRMCLRRHHEY